MHLRLVSHPLPVSWDGCPVKWSRWDAALDVIICPPNKAPRCECGSNAKPFVSTGLRAPDTGAEQFARRHALRDLRAFRCPGCGEFAVWDMTADTWWTLDETDYGPDGSTAPVTREWSGGLLDLLP